jgi:hypothetical protein
MSNYGQTMVQQKNGVRRPRRPNAQLTATVSPAVEIHKPRTKMFFLRKWWNQFVLNSVQQANRDNDNSKELVVSEREHIDTNPLRLHIYYGSGGIAIETKYFDRRRDEHINQLYIVPESANLTEELERILTMENLRRA